MILSSGHGHWIKSPGYHGTISINIHRFSSIQEIKWTSCPVHCTVICVLQIALRISIVYGGCGQKLYNISTREEIQALLLPKQIFWCSSFKVVIGVHVICSSSAISYICQRFVQVLDTYRRSFGNIFYLAMTIHVNAK